MATIHYYVHGRGRGHATRSLAVVAALRARGHALRVFAGRDALPLLRASTDVQPVDSLPPAASAAGLRLALRRAIAAARAIRRDRAALVISDGDLPAALGAVLARRPAVAVGHGLVFSVCRRPTGMSWPRWWRERCKARVASLGAARRIAVSFVPLAMHDDAALLVRPVPPAVRREEPDGTVVVYMRDGLDAALADALGRLAVPVEIFGSAAHGLPVRPLERATFLAALARARAVIASAGSQLIGECIALGVPMLAVYDPHDDEQALNAALLERAGLGRGVARPDLDLAMLRELLAIDTATAQPWIAADVASAVVRVCDELVG